MSCAVFVYGGWIKSNQACGGKHPRLSDVRSSHCRCGCFPSPSAHSCAKPDVSRFFVSRQTDHKSGCVFFEIGETVPIKKFALENFGARVYSRIANVFFLIENIPRCPSIRNAGNWYPQLHTGIRHEPVQFIRFVISVSEKKSYLGTVYSLGKPVCGEPGAQSA